MDEAAVRYAGTYAVGAPAKESFDARFRTGSLGSYRTRGRSRSRWAGTARTDQLFQLIVLARSLELQIASLTLWLHGTEIKWNLHSIGKEHDLRPSTR